MAKSWKGKIFNGRIDFATFIIYHDESQDCYVGQVIEQGHQIGNMGKKGNATGVHCHIEIEQGSDTTFKQNNYGVYCLNNEYDTDDCYFMDDTNILNMETANWKYLKDVPVNPEPQPTKRNYTCLYDMYVRTGAGINHSVKLVKDLSDDGKNMLHQAIQMHMQYIKKEQCSQHLKLWIKMEFGQKHHLVMFA